MEIGGGRGRKGRCVFVFVCFCVCVLKREKDRKKERKKRRKKERESVINDQRDRQTDRRRGAKATPALLIPRPRCWRAAGVHVDCSLGFYLRQAFSHSAGEGWHSDRPTDQDAPGPARDCCDATPYACATRISLFDTTV